MSITMLGNYLLQILGQEWFWVIIIVVVVLFGSSKIPSLARSIGRATGEFQKGKLEIEKEIETAKKELDKTPERLKLEEAAKALGIEPVGKTDQQLRDAIKQAA
jgi:sec-independent protein translocase protein TatA